MRKVEEIKMNLMRKNKARERYARYLDGRQGGAGQGRIHRFATDYTAWDLWTPSDEVRLWFCLLSKAAANTPPTGHSLSFF